MKRILSMLVVFAMVISMVPNVVAARDTIDMDELLEKLKVLESIDEINVSLKEGATSKNYEWTPTKNGTLSLVLTEATDGTTLSYTVSQGDTTVEAVDGVATIDVVADTKVVIKVSEANQAAVEATILGTFEVFNNTADAPILVDFVWNAEYTEATATVTAEPGTTYYGQYGIGGLQLSVNGEDAGIIENLGMRYPSVFTITNDGEAAAEYTLKLTYPLGSWNNPATLEIGYNGADVLGGGQPYLYTWKAESDGYLTISMYGDNWTYAINNMTAGTYGDTHASVDEAVIGNETIKVTANDEIQITVGTADYSAAYVSFSASAYCTTAMDFGQLSFVWNEEQTEATANVLVPVGTVSYGGYSLGGMLLSINGGEATLLEGNFRNPPVFTITNDGEKAAVYSLKLTFPEGSWNNPAELQIGYNGADVLGGGQPYIYTWKAESDGYLTVSMMGDNWTYTINNMTTYSYGDNHASVDETVIGTETVKVAAGDEIQITIGTADYSAAYVEFITSAYCTTPMEFGQFNLVWNEEQTEATANVLVPVGTVYYGGYSLGGMLLSINGGEATLLEGNFRNPPVFTITNDGEKAAVYSLKLTYPEGSWNNPAELQIGENTAPVKADGQGYIYTWTAEKAGELTITMKGSNWTYVINNMTSYAYGNNHASNDDPVVVTETVKVAVGDEIQITIGTADYAAADVEFTAAFEAAPYTPGDLDENNVIDEDDVIYLLQHLLMPEDFAVNQPVDYDKSGEIDEDDVIYLLQHLLMPDDFPLA